jgi:dihydroflavonol-4-reductase
MPLAFIEGVVQVHLAVADRGKRSERYLVADEHVSMAEFARLVLEADGRGRKPPKTAPAWLLNAVAGVSAPLAREFGFTPLVAPSELAFLSWDIRVNAGKARQELAFVPTPAREGIQKTVAWLQSRDRPPHDDAIVGAKAAPT